MSLLSPKASDGGVQKLEPEERKKASFALCPEGKTRKKAQGDVKRKQLNILRPVLAAERVVAGSICLFKIEYFKARAFTSARDARPERAGKGLRATKRE